MIKKLGIRVLIVDDDTTTNELLRTQLTSLGYQVVGYAYEGMRGVQMTCELKPDIVLMDLLMPNPEIYAEDPHAGLHAAQRIQELCPTPIILLSAYESPELTQRASTIGVGAYLVKPVSTNELDRAISITLARFQDLVEMRRLNAELKAHNEELDAFAYTVAHDIKHQLAITIGYAELLDMDHRTLPQRQLAQYLHEIIVSGQKLNRIVSDLLLLARVRKVEEVNLDPLDMGSVVHEAKSRLADMVGLYQVQFTEPEQWPVAMGHATWIEEVWFNYISNGIKYGGKPPHITLGAGPQKDGTLRFWVHDNGEGISEAKQARLFTPFERLSQSRGEGHGLGLSIVRRIVNKLGGDVGVESQPGQGSTFYFTLPAFDESFMIDGRQ
ncbi:MAG: response regulator [Anaerolineae bacterium]|nr:response regulator [Anaerolineae bacterium]